MKKNWNLDFGFNSAPAEGGGAATATAPAPAPAPAPASASAPEKFNPGSLFSGARHTASTPASAPKLAATPAAPAASATPAAPAAPAAPVAEPLAETPAPAPAAPAAVIPTPAAPTSVNPATAPFHEPLMGRFKNWEEAREALVRSQEEGIRRFNEAKELKAQLETSQKERDAKLADLQAQLEDARTNGVFIEKTKEELEAMRKENPSDYFDYMRSLDKREQRMAAQKAEREALSLQKQQKQEATRKEIERRSAVMKNDSKNYPRFTEMRPIMDDVLVMTGGENSFITGYPQSEEILYWVARGIAAQQAEMAGAGATEAARAAAAAKAAADAAAGAGPAAPAPGAALPPGGAPTDPDKAYKDAVRNAGKRVTFQRRD